MSAKFWNYSIFWWLVATEEASGEESSGDAVEEVIYKEPSVYDNLLMKLGSSSESVADAFKIR